VSPALAWRLLALLAAALLVGARGDLATFAAHGQTFPWPPGPVVEDGPPPGCGDWPTFVGAGASAL